MYAASPWWEAFARAGRPRRAGVFREPKPAGGFLSPTDHSAGVAPGIFAHPGDRVVRMRGDVFEGGTFPRSRQIATHSLLGAGGNGA